MAVTSRELRESPRETSAPSRGVPAPLARRLRPPSWLDARLIVGVLLVVISVAVGTKLLASADRYESVWAAARDLTPGTTVSRDDLTVAKVRFRDHGSGYLTAAADPTGRVVAIPIHAGELIPRAALIERVASPVRLVTISVDRLHLPRGDLHGAHVDVYVTLRPPDGAAARPQLVIGNVAVVDTVSDAGLGAAGVGLVLQVPGDLVADVLAASRSGTMDVVRVPTEDASAAPTPGEFRAGTVAPSQAAD
ncbi:MAG: flagella basal body P-ring formation protein FlgA [Acidothermus sp.]|nr:flagella basal body P-ring formation protein FlgA [Acidothermus sp.]